MPSKHTVKERDVQRQKLLISYFRALESISKWRDTKVSRNEAKSERFIKCAMLTCSDGLKICFQTVDVCIMMNGDDGLEL